MESYGILSLIPLVLTIILAFTTRNVIVSLGFGSLSEAIILQGFNSLNGVLYLVSSKIFDQISSPSNTQALLVIACIGGYIMSLIEAT